MLLKKSKGKTKNIYKQMKRKRQLKTYAAKAVMREVYSNTILPQETRKTPNRQPNCTPKTTVEKRTRSLKIRRKENKELSINK